MPRWAIFLLASLLCLSAPLRASIEMDDVEVSIITMGPGPLVYERFGHIAVRLRIPSAGQDILYDWGNFDFEEPNFVGKFVKGSLLYSMDVKPTDRWLGFYRDEQDRSITEQVLNLDAAQKQRLLGQLIENERNPKYLYDAFLDNCSTRVRDLLNTTLNDQLVPQMAEQTPGTIRWHTRRLMDVGLDNKMMSLLIDFAYGPGADRPLTQWHAAFVPMELSRLLDTMIITRVDGTTLPLVRERRVLNDSKLPGNAEPLVARSPVRWSLPIGAILALLVAATAKRFRAGYWLIAGAWSAFASLGAVFLVTLACFTRHWVVDWNVNLLQFSPISLGILAAVVVPRWRRPLRHLPPIAVGLSAVGFVITILTIQQAAPAICLAMPMNLSVLFGWRPAHPSVNAGDLSAKMPIA